MATTQNASDKVASIAEKIRGGKTSLGIEFGSTRIKAVLIDDTYATIAAGEHGWENHLDNGLWTYPLEEVWEGVQDAFAGLAHDVETAYGEKLTRIGAIGFSAMMHGYLAFDGQGELLVPFRTWRNTNTHEAHEKLSELFQYNIPERWSVAHLYQCLLDGEDHVGKIAYMTTLAGYVHWKLSGEKVLGVGDASGMFPIDPETHTWDTELLDKFRALPEVAAQPWNIEDILPAPLVAGQKAGTLSEEGARLLDRVGCCKPEPSWPLLKEMPAPVWLPPIQFAYVPEMFPRVPRFSQWWFWSTSSADCIQKWIWSPLLQAILRGMSHANNFTSDLNAWVKLFGQFAQAAGISLDAGTLYGTLFRAAISDEADDDAGGLLNYCFYSGEFLAGLEEGRPVFARGPESNMTLANFMRAQLFGAFAPVKIGMDVMTKDEFVRVDSLVGHGGIFTTPKVAQKILAAAFNTPIKVMSTAAEGGAWGMAVLADYLWHADTELADYLDERVFADSQSTTEQPDAKDVVGFEQYFSRFMEGLPIEKAAIQAIPLERE
ncbi:sugar kinase [Bifidobacterium tsurumiense]|uniref:Sugar kinase n=1 Tax=Bifidobacterium tsurumiense TaxID=356829 RepID=A0A087EK82_9BIFI|nr:sugar kinase [Bifidobacterium tsurumiense]